MVEGVAVGDCSPINFGIKAKHRNQAGIASHDCSPINFGIKAKHLGIVRLVAVIVAPSILESRQSVLEG